MQPSQQGTIRTYLELVREHRVLIVAMAVLTAGAALAFSLAQEPRYTARASLQFQDQSQDLARAGVASALSVTAQELAAKGSETLLEVEVLDAARRRLKLDRSSASLRRDLATTVDEKSNLVTIEAAAGSGRLAAALADTVADAAVRTQTRAERSRYGRAADRVAGQLRALRRRGGRGQAAAEVAFFDRLAALQTLSVNATPVTVTSRASVPGSPSSPKPLRNAILGLLIGLLVGGALALLRESLDTRLRDGADVQQQLELPVVAMVREQAFALTPFVDAGSGLMDDQDVEAFRILKTNLQFIDIDKQIKTIAVTSPFPEEGKSTVASSLALASEASGTRTLLIECDLRRPALAGRLGATQEPGLTDLLSGAATAADAMQSIDYAKAAEPTGDNGSLLVREWQKREQGSLAFVAAGSKAPLPTEMLASQRFREFLEEARNDFELVIVDTAPLLSVADTREVLPLVDGILVCIRVDRTTRDQALAGKAVLERLPKKPSGVVVTGLKRGRAANYGYYAQAYEQYTAPQATG